MLQTLKKIIFTKLKTQSLTKPKNLNGTKLKKNLKVDKTQKHNSKPNYKT